MDNITSSIITPIVQSLMDHVKKHLGFLVSSTKYVNDMKEKKDELNLTEQVIQHNLDEAIERNHEVPPHASPWLGKVKKVNEKAKSIPTGGIGCFNMAKRYKAGKQSYNILKEIEALETSKSKIVFTDKQIPLAVVASTGPSTSTPYDTKHNFFESRKEVFDAALKSLQPNNESQKMIALSGMGGVGKTTMMEQLKKEVEASKMFDRVVKVVLGENMSDIIAIQRAIAINITVEDLREETKDERADRLLKMFEKMSQQGKKVLVIMDDLWNVFDLKDVGLSPLPNGFKLLFTSRDGAVCTNMGVRKNLIFKVGYLNYEEARTLFFRVVGLSDGEDPTRQKIGEDIVRKCGGLPIAIVTIAKSLSDNIEDAWKKALWRLEEDDLEDLESITYRIFELSYENLKKDEDKAIFILSGIFPDDFNIRTEDLLRFGWGLGFFKDAKNLTIARIDMKICVNNLIRANLLIESDDTGCVKMHDLVRAFVLNKVSKVKQASVMNYDNRSDQYAKESYDRILLNCKGVTEFPADFSYPNLSMLMLMDGYELLMFPEDIYERMKKLEVVSYENMHIPMLPEHSTKLRTLCLRSCSFINDDVSLLGSLSNLEALCFVDCQIGRLPSTIGKLKKLRLLDLTGCVDLRVDDGVFQNLVSLEELYMRIAYKDSPIRFTDANCDELEKLSHGLFALELEFFENKARPNKMSFKNLERFRISIGCKLEVNEMKGERNLFRNTIRLVGDCNELLECEISELFDKTEELHLQVNEMNHLEDVLTHHSFSKLTVLHVSKCADLTCVFTVDVASGLKMLERLTISECHVMRTLVAENSSVGVIRFQKLRFMSLTNLPEMVSLCDNVIDLPEMVELILDGLPNFTSIYPHKSEMESLLNKKVVIPRLEKLYIRRMKNLKQIWPCEIATGEKNNVSLLKEITIEECDSLINLFPSNPLPLLNHLEELLVVKCGSVEVLFNMEFESVCENISKLRRIEVDNLGKLKELWRMKGVNTRHIKCFKGVENIEIKHCPIFKDVFTPATANFDLGALTTYFTKNTGEKIDGVLKGEISEMDDYIPNVRYPSYLLHTCHHLQRLKLIADNRVGEVVFSLPQQFPFQNLTEIILRSCDKIKYLFSPLMAKYLSNLKMVDIQRCDGIEEVISSRDDENEENTTSTSSHHIITFFLHLDTLELRDLPCLKRIDGGDHTRSSRDKISSDITNTIHDETQSAQVIGASWSFCQYPRNIRIDRCDALGSLIPWYAVGQMKRLQQLEIRSCSRMMEIFESESSTNNNVDEGSVAGTTLTSPTLKTIPTLLVPQLSNLKSMFIYECDLLTHVFTFSTLESLKQLKELKVRNCKAIQVIVKEEEGMSSKVVVLPRLETLILDVLPNLKGFFLGVNDFKWRSLDDVMIKDCPQLSNLKVLRIHGCDFLTHVFTFSTLESLKQLKELEVTNCKAVQVIVKEENGTSSKDVVMFPRLERLILDKLPNLKGFFLGVNDFKWPSLDDVMIEDCPQLMMFTSGESKTPKLKYIRTSLGRHSLECGLNFHRTINEYQTTFSTSSDAAISKGMPWSFHNLIEINKEYTNYRTMIPSHALLQLQKLQKIHLKGCRYVEEVFEVELEERNNESQTTAVKIPNLTQVELESVYNLKYLWKGTQWMVLEIPNLTTVDIQWCSNLEHVFTCSMVGSLVQLQDLHISDCKNIKVIVKKEEEECDDKVNEIIMLPRLKSLKLYGLSSVEGFCLGNIEAFSLPALDTLEIKGCPAIEVFTKGYLSTPDLKVIDTDFGKYYVKPDLNSFIKSKQARRGV